ncbi:hypothetical protein PMAYCL1PPCAC_33072, partial [Pristionchus mayeri]
LDTMAESREASDVDYLMRLPNDCLRDIMERLDQFDLDELEQTCSGLRDLSLNSRSRARKIEAAELSVSQIDLDNFIFSMVYGDRTYAQSVNVHASELFKNKSDEEMDVFEV